MTIRRSCQWMVGLLLGTGLLIASGAEAATIRDDVSDSAYLSLGAASSYVSVGRVTGLTPDYGFSASGVLIASDAGSSWVLTAAHVVDEATSLSFNLGGSTFSATGWVAHSEWNGDLGKGYDIGLMQFTTNITAATGVASAQRYTGSNEVGHIGTSVGYGMTGTGLTGAVTFDAQKRGIQNAIDALLRTPGKDNRVLLADFDNPNNSADSSMGSSAPLSWEGSIAPGDSGGGMFISVGGIDLLAGIHSFGWGLLDGDPDSDYGDAYGMTRVSSFNKWIDSIIGSSGDGDGGGGGNKGKGGGKPFGLTSAVPEPGTALLLIGGVVLLHRQRR